ncbi:MAG TPA: hypothetical protein DG757_27265 [Bacillus sp. (in: Bacteria)]|nr:hypothetical protein [Bacillus sp. (in: firmicutes)]
MEPKFAYSLFEFNIAIKRIVPLDFFDAKKVLTENTATIMTKIFVVYFFNLFSGFFDILKIKQELKKKVSF